MSKHSSPNITIINNYYNCTFITKNENNIIVNYDKCKYCSKTPLSYENIVEYENSI